MKELCQHKPEEKRQNWKLLPRKRRDAAPQESWLRARREVQKKVVAMVLHARKYGISRKQVARLVGLNRHTIEEWARAWEKNKLAFKPRGRSQSLLPPDKKLEIETLLFLVTPFIGAPTLWSLFPDLSKRALERLLYQTQNSWIEEGKPFIWSLRWHHPGRVWAIDFTEAEAPIDGVFPYLLMVRDLASGFTLLSRPVKAEDAASVLPALMMLFAWAGAPLVLKSDNGGAFKAEETQALLERHGVVSLISPPYMPEYNAAEEVGHGAQKTWMAILAAQNGRPGESTSDDAEGSKLRNNELGRPFGKYGPTPKQAWAGRTEISTKDRQILAETIERFRNAIRNDEEIDGQKYLWDMRENDLQRTAISLALKKLGYYSTERRPLSQANRAAIRRTYKQG